MLESDGIVALELSSLLDSLLNKINPVISSSSILKDSSVSGDFLEIVFPEFLKSSLLLEDKYLVDLSGTTLSFAVRNSLMQHFALRNINLEYKVTGSVCVLISNEEMAAISNLCEKVKKEVLHSGKAHLINKITVSLVNGILNLRVKMSGQQSMVFRNCKTDEELLECLKRSIK